MSEAKVSIIVPVYNLERYLEKNVVSLLSQSHKNLEIIYIDDGSNDHSVDVIRTVAHDDERVKIISQKNSGPSVARNRGIKEATGEFIMFVDGDDYLAEKAVELMAGKMVEGKLDVLQGQVNTISLRKDPISTKGTKSDIMSGKEWLLKNDISYTCCAYMYRKDFIIDNSLFFSVGMFHEDVDLIPRALYLAERFMRTDIVFYYQVPREGSITKSCSMKRCYDMLKIINHTKRFIREKNVEKEVIQGFFLEYMNFCMVQSIHMCILGRFQIDKICADKRRAYMVNHLSKSKNKKYRLLAVVLKLHIEKIYAQVYLNARNKNFS